MSSLFFWFVYFTLDDVYKVKATFDAKAKQTNNQKLIPRLPTSIHICGFKPNLCHFGFTVHLIISDVIGVHIKPYLFKFAHL